MSRPGPLLYNCISIFCQLIVGNWKPWGTFAPLIDRQVGVLNIVIEKLSSGIGIDRVCISQHLQFHTIGCSDKRTSPTQCSMNLFGIGAVHILLISSFIFFRLGQFLLAINLNFIS